MPHPPQASVKENFLYSILYTFLNIAFPILTFAYVARILGPEALGRLNFTVAAAGFFSLAAAMAMPLYGAREIALARGDRARLDAVFSELFQFNLASTGVSLLGYGSLFLFSHRVQQDWRLFLICGGNIAANAFTLDWFLQGLEDYRIILFRNFAAKLGSFGVLVAFVHRREDILIAAASAVLGTAANAALGFLIAVKRARLAWLPWSRLRTHVRPMAVLSASTLAASTYVYLDSVLLGVLAGNAAVGFFSAGTRATRVAISVSQSLTTAIIPRFSRYAEQARVDEYRAMARKSLAFVYFVSFPAAAAILVLAPRVIGVLSGPGFARAIPVMRISAPLVILMGYSGFVGLQVLFTSKGDGKLLKATLMSAGACTLINLLLVPHLAEKGTAVALISAEACSALALTLLAGRQRLSFGIFPRAFLRYPVLSAAAALVMWLVARPIGPDLPALAAAGVAGAAFYLTALAGLKDPLVIESLNLAAKKLGYGKGIA